MSDLPPPPIQILPPTAAEVRRVGERETLTLTEPSVRWGDLVMTAKSGTLERTGTEMGRLELRGDVRILRGPDTLLAEAFGFDGATGIFTATDATLDGPPVRIVAKSLRGSLQGGLTFDGVRFGFRTGELTVAARTGTISAQGRLIARGASVSLWRLKILRLSSLRGHLGADNERGGVTVPLTARSSAVSGQVLGVRVPFALYGADGLAEVDQTSRRGMQYGLTFKKTIAQGRKANDWQAVPFGRDPKLSPLTSFTVARPASRDPLALSEEFFSVASPVRPALWTEALRADLSLDYQHRRDFAGRRQGPFLLSRQPEARLTMRYPLSPARTPVSGDALKTVRWVGTVNASAGNYTETRLGDAPQIVRKSRAGVTLGLESSPLKVGESLLAATRFSLTDVRYGGGAHFRVSESTGGLEWKPAPYTGLGVALINRETTGVSPLFFDQIDAGREGQLRARVNLGKTGLAVGMLRRWDLTQKRPFDTEYALVGKGDGISPRISYRTLNHQFQLSFSLPALQ